MPRSPTILTPPPGILPFVPNTTIRSQDANALFNDLYQDGNTPRPIAYGGTGASNAQDALNNLGAVGQSNFLSAFSIGDGYYSARDISADGGVWLRRDGKLYNSSDYPELAALMPSLPDGIEWTSFGTGVPNAIKSIAVTPTEFYILSGNDIYRSTDFVSFSNTATLPSSITALKIYYFNGTYCVSGFSGSGAGMVCSSTDGVTWTAPSTITGIQGQICSIAFDGTNYVAVGNGNGGNGAGARSADLSTWTAVTMGTSGPIYDIKYDNSTFVVVTGNGGISTSSDGTTWTARASGVSSSLEIVCYGNGLWVAAGSNGVILTSSNLSVWNPRTSGTTQTLSGGVVYSTSGYMIAGAGGVVRISANGTTWSASITGTSSRFVSVDFNKNEQNIYYAATQSGILQGIRTLPTQFRVPNDSPQYGWIKAEND